MPVYHGKQRHMKKKFFSRICYVIVIVLVTWQEIISKTNFMFVIFWSRTGLSDS